MLGVIGLRISEWAIHEITDVIESVFGHVTARADIEQSLDAIVVGVLEAIVSRVHGVTISLPSTFQDAGKVHIPAVQGSGQNREANDGVVTVEVHESGPFKEG